VIQIGSGALLAAMLGAGWGALASLLAIRTGNRKWMENGRISLLLATLLLTLALLLLVWALVSHDFSLEYVASHTSTDLPVVYSASALWAGQAGSLLLWSWLLALFSLVAMYRHHHRHDEIQPHVQLILCACLFFFTGLVNFAAPPFHPLFDPPGEGLGLNPLLQNPQMLFHPPVLYLGYVGFTIPFALALGALFCRKPGGDWLGSARDWTLFSWFFLTLGNVLGAQWAYLELGWGGYWAWDPVENASLIPWLVSTACLHSVMLPGRAKMPRTWNQFLFMLTFVLCLFATFLTRSGILSSIHAFTPSKLGPALLGFLLLVMTMSATGLIIGRKQPFESCPADSLLSRESAFRLNNLLLLAAAFAVLWGTLFPLVSERLIGTRLSLGPPYFNRVMVPIGLALLFLLGACPLLSWRHTSGRELMSKLLFPVGAALLGGGALWLAGIRHFWALSTFAGCIFAFLALAMESVRGQKLGFSCCRRRLGSHIIHLGIILIYLGIAGSSALSVSREGTLAPGQSMEIAGYQLTLRDMKPTGDESRYGLTARVDFSQEGRIRGTLKPEMSYFKNRGPVDAKIALHSTLLEDLYLVFVSFDPESGRALFQAKVSPLVIWIWIGCGVMVPGFIMVFQARAGQGAGASHPPTGPVGYNSPLGGMK